MDLFDILLNVGLVTAAIVAYLLIFRRSSPTKFLGSYRQPAWNYPFRVISAKFAVKRWKSRRPKSEVDEAPRETQSEGWDCVTLRCSSNDGTTILLAIRKLCGRQPLAEVTVNLRLPDGTTFKLAKHPDTVVTWEGLTRGWSASGLKIQVLEPECRLRILFNGLLDNVTSNTTQHVRFNFTWTSATSVVRYPEDWSEELAAQALALEPWRDDKWPYTLGKWGDSSWLQFGTVQGRFNSYDSSGAVDKSEYLETRGVRERSSSPQGYQGLRRSLTITATAKDGTAVHLHGFSYNDVLTQGFHGSIRFPDFTVRSITGTDLVMANFCEVPDGIPKVYKIQVSAGKRNLTIIMRINADGGRLLSGMPYKYEVHYRTFSTEIDGEIGTGILELGYETTVQSRPSIDLVPSPSPTLRWLTEREVGAVGYCLPFESRAATCPNYVGGKGASLALLASVQKQQGYRVPPGYCLTKLALEKHLQTNPELLNAIMEIEAANEDYDEKFFKDKCTKTAELFSATEIKGQLREEILTCLKELRRKATHLGLGPELRFAVRSSAVGEDSEALSAAGQNETVLGCVSDSDVVRGVQKCWGSMFAFTSAYYRRQNGQPCLCGGGVVVQALVRPRAAGVMFTRHPDAGDPSRLLITANYGLGESVVSGSVEPDTITISRGKELTISKIELGSKKQRIITSEDGVIMEEVSEDERKMPCLTVTEILTLAELGVAQERLWGAARDIEWAICQGEMFLLQARPITSLERWTDEELLHELDMPIMSDDEILTFANTGEVLPKPLTALSYDILYMPLRKGVNDTMYDTHKDGHDVSIAITHNRCALALYNSVYRRLPDKIDVTIRMMEMAIHGHKVADDYIHSVSKHRRPGIARWENALLLFYSIKYLITTNSKMNDTKDIVKKLNFNTDTTNLSKLLASIADTKDIMRRCAFNHSSTTSGSVVSQLFAMMILIEGQPDFTAEQCQEMNTLLNSGEVLSAEVPRLLAQLSRELESSGKVDEFRSQDPKEAMRWLETNLPEVYSGVCKFLERHGHRAIMEFDLATKPWALVPEQMIEMLQNMRHSNEEQKKVTLSNADIIASLKTPKKPITRRLLKLLLPLCHRTVRHREDTKAHVILMIHKIRLAALRLGRLMVRQWYLPDPDLIFHFRLYELEEYILTRDPALLKKAAQRCQHHPSWCKLKFAEMNTGWVRPLQSGGPVVTSGDVRVEGTSVCGGEVIARACVVKDLSEIGQIQRGDILITHSTDIGWSPYFPLVTGIVTELGGLISHGAVIAREYGLPCIVGAMDATEMFKTGDMVRLSGTKGVLERVQVTEKPDENES